MRNQPSVVERVGVERRVEVARCTPAGPCTCSSPSSPGPALDAVEHDAQLDARAGPPVGGRPSCSSGSSTCTIVLIGDSVRPHPLISGAPNAAIISACSVVGLGRAAAVEDAHVGQQPLALGGSVRWAVR